MIQRLAIHFGNTVDGNPARVPLAPVTDPEPTIFPSGLPTASIPVVRAAV